MIDNFIFRAIECFVANALGKVVVSWDEVEKAYASGKHPEINEAIDYILGGSGN